MLSVEIADDIGVTVYADVRRVGYQRKHTEGAPIGITLWFDRRPPGLLSHLIAQLKPRTRGLGFVDETAVSFDRGTVTIWQADTAIRTFTIGEG